MSVSLLPLGDKMLRVASFRVAMVSSVILFVGAVAVVVAAQVMNAGRPGDPFAALAVLMPGQPLSGVGEDFKYSCEPVVPLSQLILDCNVDSTHTRFTRLVTTVHKGIIDRLTIEGVGVSVGEMASRWGTGYSIQRLGHTRFIRWNQGQYATVPADVPFGYFLPIKMLTFTKASLP